MGAKESKVVNVIVVALAWMAATTASTLIFYNVDAFEIFEWFPLAMSLLLGGIWLALAWSDWDSIEWSDTQKALWSAMTKVMPVVFATAVTLNWWCMLLLVPIALPPVLIACSNVVSGVISAGTHLGRLAAGDKGRKHKE